MGKDKHDEEYDTDARSPILKRTPLGNSTPSRTEFLRADTARRALLLPDVFCNEAATVFVSPPLASLQTGTYLLLPGHIEPLTTLTPPEKAERKSLREQWPSKNIRNEAFAQHCEKVTISRPIARRFPLLSMATYESNAYGMLCAANERVRSAFEALKVPKSIPLCICAPGSTKHGLELRLPSPRTRC